MIKTHTYYFLGIGGIGMSALARYFNKRGFAIHGYDKTESTLTRQLTEEGMHVHYSDDPSKIPADTELVIQTPAVPKDLKMWERILTLHIPIKKRAQVLGEITATKNNIAIAGTHGKTTTSTILSHILFEAKLPVTCFLGGIAKNYGTNFLDSGDRWVVSEADEYDRSFLELTPDIAVIGSLDADHLDIYGSRESMISHYQEFALKIKTNGQLYMSDSISTVDCQRFRDLRSDIRIEQFGFSPVEIKSVISGTKSGWTTFSYIRENCNITELSIRLPGEHNIKNALVAVHIALNLGITEDQIRKSLHSFKGIQRRFEWIRETEKNVLIDDYAHHPEELRATIKACRECYPDRNITGIFQPHLYSRTRDFLEEFADVLSTLDQLVLLDIYPAREKPIPGITSQVLFEKINSKQKVRCEGKDLIDVLCGLKLDVVMTLGAGDIDLRIKEIENCIFQDLHKN